MTDRVVTCWYSGYGEFTCPECGFQGEAQKATDGRASWVSCPNCHEVVMLPDESALDIS